MSDQLQKYTLADSFNRCQFFFKIKQIFEEMKLIVGTRDGGLGESNVYSDMLISL